MVEQCGIAGTVLGFGTHALLGAASGVLAEVLQELIAIDALELAAGKLAVTLETLAEGTGQGVTLYAPELCNTDAGRVALQGGTHRGIEAGLRAASHQNQQGFVFQ